MAKTTAIDSKQCRRAKPKGSPTLCCALGSRFWGESPDGNVISRLSSGYLGRKPGRETFFLHLIRISGEISRTSVAPPYTLARLWAKSDQGVSGTQPNKLIAECLTACNQTGTNQNILRFATRQAQAKLCERDLKARTAWLESMAIVFAIDAARNSNSLWRAYLPEATFFRIRNTYFYP